jgi:hypothetical protein
MLYVGLQGKALTDNKTSGNYTNFTKLEADYWACNLSGKLWQIIPNDDPTLVPYYLQSIITKNDEFM